MHATSVLPLRREAPAKVNLGLHVLRRRGDGFHDIETVFLRIPWSDVVTVRAGDHLSMSCSDPALPTDDTNTCMRAARALASRHGPSRGAHIHLDKRVPYGAGLGSGSSDAATTLLLLNELWNVGAAPQDLMEVAAEVGSDVAFFLNGPLAYAEGRGERISALDCGAEVVPAWMVIVVPPVHISSGEAYRLVEPRETGRIDLRDAVCSADVERWRRSLVNDFEAPVLARHPEIRDAKRVLGRSGALFAGLSGSGSAVFGLFDREDVARKAAASAEFVTTVVWCGSVRD